MPRHYKLPGNITTYDLKVCKIPDGYEPQEALDACVNPIIDDRGNPGTFYPSNTGIGNSIIGAFEQGARYAVRVTIHEFDQMGDEVVFANEGRSEVTWFRYGEPCISPESFTMKETGPGRVQLSWSAQSGVDSYKILYRLFDENNWKVQVVAGTTGVIQGLPKGKYEFAVQSGCTGQIPDHTQTWEIGTEDDELDELPPTLMSPLQILVQVSGCNAVAAGNLADYYANFPRTDVPGSGNNPVDSTKPKIPACALQSGAFADCDAELPVIPVPIGSTPLNTLQAGDVLGIYDFAAFVTEVTQTPSGFSGKALVRLPFLQGALALAEFSGLKAWSARGEDDQVRSNPARGGCVYEVSTFQLINVSQTEVAEAKAKLLNTLAKQTDSTAFAGTLAGALLAYYRMSPTATADSVCRYKTAILQATGQITDALAELDSDHPVVTGILKDLKTIADSLQAGNIVDHITDKYEAIIARLHSLKAADTDTNPSVLAIGNVQINELTGQSARISWEATGDVAKTPSRYVIEYTDPNGATLPETVTSPQVNLQRLLPGTQYKYRITAYDGDRVLATYGEDAFSTPKRVVPMPENLAYTAMGYNGVSLSWDKNRDHRSYKLIYTDQFGEEKTLYPTTNTARIEGLARDQKYAYRIVAVGDNGLESEVVHREFNIGTVCETRAYAAKPRIIQGEQVQLWLAGCLDEDGRNGPTEWTDGENTFSRRVIYATPQKTTTYVATCLLTRQLPDGQTEPVYCPAEVTVIVDKKCEGVVATASPSSIEMGEPVILQSNGCSENIQWVDNFPEDNILGTNPVEIINPIATKTHTLSCIDKEKSQCSARAGKVEVLCALKLAVSYHQPYVNYEWYQPGKNWEIASNDQLSHWLEGLSYAGLGLPNALAFNLLKWAFIGKNKSQASIQAVGCPGTVTWEYSKGNAGDSPAGSNILYLQKLKNNTKITASCVVEGQVCTAELELDKPDNDCKDFRITISEHPSKNGSMILSASGSTKVTWENGAIGNDRTISPPLKSTVYTANNSDECSESIGFDVPINKVPISVPCSGLNLTKVSGNTTIKRGETGTILRFKATGCTDGQKAVPLVWYINGVLDNSKLISSDITGDVKDFSFNAIDDKKSFEIKVYCPTTTKTVSQYFTITKEPDQPIISQPEKLRNPCNFFLQTAHASYYNTFLPGEKVEIKVIGVADNLQAFVTNDANDITSKSADVKRNGNEATITVSTKLGIDKNGHSTFNGSFYVAVSNIVTGASPCENRILINVNSNRTADPYYTFFPIDLSIQRSKEDCGKYLLGHEIPIIKRDQGSTIRILKDQSSLLDFGVISLYIDFVGKVYDGSTNPEQIGLVDKVCHAKNGSNSEWFRQKNQDGLSGPIKSEMHSGYVCGVEDNPNFNSAVTYYSRCTFKDGSYCVNAVKVNPAIPFNGRISSTEDQTIDSGCQFSKRAALEILLKNLLCENLSVLHGNNAEKLEIIKAELSKVNVELAEVTDEMIASLTAGKCSEVVKALAANISGNESVQTLNQSIINQDFASQVANQVIEAISEDEVINSDFITRQVETFDGPIEIPNGRVQAIGVCPEYYFTPSGKRIRIPNIGNCVVSINGVLMSFERNGKKYIPLYKRSTLAFIGYHEEADFNLHATISAGTNAKIAQKDLLTKWIIDTEYPAENSKIGRFISFIEENKNKPGVVSNYTEANFAEIKALLAQLPETIFENVEGASSVFLFDLLKIKNSLSKTLSATDAQLAILNSILTNPETVCTQQSEVICKVYACVYSQITGNQNRDVFNGRLPLENRKRLLTLLAQSTLTSGTLPGGCAFSSDGEGTVVSLLRTTPETDRKAVLDHLYSVAISASHATPLKAFISKIDGANFDDFMLILSDWVTTQYPSAESWSAILQRQDRAKRTLMVLGDWSLGSTLMTSVIDGRTLFDFNITVLGKTPILKPNIDALDYVVVKFTKDFSIGSTTFRTGELYKIPAMLCYLIMNDQKNKSIATTGKYTAYALGAAIGVSEIMAAATAVEMTLAIIDMGMLATDFAVNEALVTRINQTQTGKTWLDNFNKFVLAYGAGRGLAELSGLTREMRTSASVINDEEVTALTSQLTAKIGALGSFAAKLQANTKFVTEISDLRHFTTVDDFVVQFEKLQKLAPINSIKPLNDVIDDFDYFVTNHINDIQSNQFKDFLDEMMQTANSTQADKFKAAATSLEVIRNPQKYIPAKFNLDKLELEDLIPYADDAGDFRFDIKWNGFRGTDKVSIFIDTKNYSTASNMFKSLGQYKAYLAKINNFDELYIIQQGGRGFTRDQIINRLQSAIKSDHEGVFNVIWTNQSLRIKIFGDITDNSEALEIFMKSIDDKSSDIFNTLQITQ